MKGLYTFTYESGEDRKNLGYDYRPNLLKRSLSNRLFKNGTMKGFLDHVNDIFVKNIDSVKRIKTFFNYIVEKDDIKIN